MSQAIQVTHSPSQCVHHATVTPSTGRPHLLERVVRVQRGREKSGKLRESGPTSTFPFRGSCSSIPYMNVIEQNVCHISVFDAINTFSTPRIPSYYSFAFTQYDPFGHSYSAMLDLCISMLQIKRIMSTSLSMCWHAT